MGIALLGDYGSIQSSGISKYIRKREIKHILKSFNIGKQFAHRKKTEAVKEPPSGALDGITLFRFAHMWRNASSGGVEAYLRSLNRHLLQRNRMQILQMYLVSEDGPFDVEIEQVGQGELVWIPSLLKSKSGQQMTKARHLWAKLIERFSHQSRVCHDLLLSTLVNYQITLAVFHWISEDSKIVLRYLNKRRVPFVVVNHFQNARLKRRYIKRQISEARAIGGVSNIDVPSFVRSRFTNLSDGIDTDFFHPEKAVPLARKIEGPLILLPSRITEGKGHLDAIRALGWLVREGFSAILIFAGRQESQALIEKLERIISEEGVQENVLFAGELDPEELRNWYAASDLVVLPSYAEGLGKVLLEAQAMKVPPVAYIIGGTPEGIQHGKTGFLVTKGDIQALTTRLRELLTYETKRRAMGEEGRRFVQEKFNLEALAERHEKFYLTVLKSNKVNYKSLLQRNNVQSY